MAYTTIDDPSAYFTTTLWTGSGTSSGRSITNDANAGDFKPDWLWIKPRTGTNAAHHQLYDSSRGVSKSLRSNADAAEIASSAYGHVSAFDTNGFTSVAGSNNNENLNENSSTFVAWQWKCNGGTKADNDDGSVTVNLQVNQEAGFSIGTYTGTGSQLTLGHGLGAVPKLHITKKLNAADAWNVYHESIGNTHGLRLNNADAKEDFGFYGDTSPTSSVFTVGGVTDNDRLNTNGGSYVFYSFAEKQGYSRFGSYVGNANANGTFVYLGFKPAWVLIKKSSAGENWSIVDNKRSPFNVMDERLVPNSSAVEESNQGGGDSIDFVSNGFKCRDGAGQFNDANTYVYMAFAEHPFVSSEGVPTTAK